MVKYPCGAAGPRSHFRWVGWRAIRPLNRAPVAVGRSESRRIGVPERLGAGHERDMSGFLGSTRAPLRWVRRVTGISMRFSLRCGLGGRSNGSIAANVVILLHRGTRPCLVSPGYISRCPDGPPLPLMDISELVQLVGPRAVAGTFGAIMNCLLGAVGCRLPPRAVKMRRRRGGRSKSVASFRPFPAAQCSHIEMDNGEMWYASGRYSDVGLP